MYKKQYRYFVFICLDLIHGCSYSVLCPVQIAHLRLCDNAGQQWANNVTVSVAKLWPNECMIVLRDCDTMHVYGHYWVFFYNQKRVTPTQNHRNFSRQKFPLFMMKCRLPPHCGACVCWRYALRLPSVKEGGLHYHTALTSGGILHSQQYQPTSSCGVRTVHTSRLRVIILSLIHLNNETIHSHVFDKIHNDLAI